MIKKNNFFWRFQGNEKNYLLDILKRGLKPKKKTYNSILEKKWSQFHNLNYSVTINSCTSALHIALLSLGCKQGDEVLVPSLTPVMCANAIIFTGATPVFVDVDQDTFLMSPEDLIKKITLKTKVILLVHMYGGINNCKLFKKIAKKNNLLIVEDCAESFGGKDENGKLVGTMGDVACWSFQTAKHLTCGDGGILSTNNKKIAIKIRMYSNLGFKFLTASADKILVSKNSLQNPKTDRFKLIGYNYRMNEFSAAVALAQLERAKFYLKMRRKVSKKFIKIIEKYNILKVQKINEKTYSTFYTLSAKLIKKNIVWKNFRKKFIEFGGDPIYAASKILQDEPSIKYSKLGRCFKTCSSSCLKKCKGTPVAKKLQKEIFNFTTNQGSVKEINKQCKALERTLDYFK